MEHNDNLHLFSSQTAFNIIHVTLYISLYCISIKKYFMLFVYSACFLLKLKNFLVVLGLELSASHLLGGHSTT
jgi:hypothetical protein